MKTEKMYREWFYGLCISLWSLYLRFLQLSLPFYHKDLAVHVVAKVMWKRLESIISEVFTDNERMVFNWQKHVSFCFFKIYMFCFPFYYSLPWVFTMCFELMNLSLWEKIICTWPEINKGECSYLNKKIQNQPFICMLRNPDPGS